MEIRQLRYFAALARVLNFHGAARELGVSQGALSQTIAILEEELQVKLFERGEGALGLSQAGERLKLDAAAVLEAEASAARAVEAIRTAKPETLRVGMSPSHRALAEAAILQMLKDKSLPDLCIKTEEVEGAVLEQRLLEGYVDVGLTFMQEDEPRAGLVCKHKKAVPLSIIVSSAHPWANRQTVGAKELRAEDPPLALLRAGLRIRRHVDQYFEKHKIAPRILVETNVMQTLLAVVRERKDMVAVLAQPEDAATIKGVALIPLEPRVLTTAVFWRVARKSRKRGGGEDAALKTPLAERFETEVLAIRDAKA